MQKKVFLSVVMSACLMGTTVTVFNACSNDEVEEQQLESKADYLRAKAKEFSKKYGVDIRIDEENILQWAETMTVEKLEEKIQKFASLKGKTFLLEDKETAKKGIKICRTKSLKENQQEPEHDPLKVYEGSGEKVVGDTEVHATWKFGNTVSNSVRVTVYKNYTNSEGDYTTTQTTEALTIIEYKFEPVFTFEASKAIKIVEDNLIANFNVVVECTDGSNTVINF